MLISLMDIYGIPSLSHNSLSISIIINRGISKSDKQLQCKASTALILYIASCFPFNYCIFGSWINSTHGETVFPKKATKHFANNWAYCSKVSRLWVLHCRWLKPTWCGLASEWGYFLEYKKSNQARHCGQGTILEIAMISLDLCQRYAVLVMDKG